MATGPATLEKVSLSCHVGPTVKLRHASSRRPATRLFTPGNVVVALRERRQLRLNLVGGERGEFALLRAHHTGLDVARLEVRAEHVLQAGERELHRIVVPEREVAVGLEALLEKLLFASCSFWPAEVAL